MERLVTTVEQLSQISTTNSANCQQLSMYLTTTSRNEIDPQVTPVVGVKRSIYPSVTTDEGKSSRRTPKRKRRKHYHKRKYSSSESESDSGYDE